MSCNGMAYFQTNFMLQTPHEEHQMPPSQEFHGKRSMSFSGIEEANAEDEISDDGSLAGEKKRRLNMEQVKTLEKNFELGNKLEPERKMQLARTLGLQPRQIAIWFQNRRARWKTKQLEKEYDLLKTQYEAIKADNDALQAQNQKLHAQILALKSGGGTEAINLNKESEGCYSNRSENECDVKLNISSPPTSRNLFPLFQTRPNQNQLVKEGTLTNMFCNMEDQSGFWPWLDQQHFN